MAPKFIRDLVHPYLPNRVLRSSGKNFLQVNRPSTKFYGARSFTVAAATECNRLPQNIRQAESVTIFKSRLKHIFFVIATIADLLKVSSSGSGMFL